MLFKVVVIDTVIKGFNHVTINHGLLEMLLHKGATITLMCEARHAEIITDSLSLPVTTIPINVISPRIGFLNKLNDWRKKLSYEKHFFDSLTDHPVIEAADFVLFTTITPVNLYRNARIINKLAQRKKVLIGLHGELESLFKNELSQKERLFKYFYRLAFIRTSDVKYLLWSPFIQNNLIQRGYLQESQTLSARHPLLKISFDQMQKQLPQSNEPVIFSHLGVASPRKNTQLLFEIGNKMTQRNGLTSANYRLRNIGKVDHAMTQRINKFVEIMSTDNQALTQQEYFQYIRDTHYTLSFISGEEYVNRISGSILDTVQYFRPIIALRHPFIEDVFEQAGDIGYLCDSIEEMMDILCGIIEGNASYRDRYSKQVHNLHNYAQMFYCNQNSELLMESISKVGW